MGIAGYLLDTNILSHLAGSGLSSKVEAVKTCLDRCKDSAPIYISVISWGEIEYGWRVGSPELLRDNDRKLFRQFTTLEITHHTAKAYAELRANLFNKFAPKEKRNKKRRVEQLIGPISALELGIQENDLWLAAQALERNLLLATGDRMQRIKAVVSNVDNLRFEDWTKT